MRSAVLICVFQAQGIYVVEEAAKFSLEDTGHISAVEAAAGGNVLNGQVRVQEGLLLLYFAPDGGSDASNWGRIILGAPKSTITVNNATVANSAFALVSVTLGSTNAYSVAANTYKGMVVLRDGSTIPAGYLTTVGLESKYADNPLTEVQFNDLLKLGCLFISASGYYSELSGFGWRDRDEGSYWSCSSNGVMSRFDGSYGIVSGASTSTTYNSNYLVVKLVKIL